MRWVRIRIRTAAGRATIRRAWQCGAWAAHPIHGTLASDDRWAVTHVPSGFCVPPGFYSSPTSTECPLSEIEAREVALLLHARADVRYRALVRYGREVITAIVAEAIAAAAELSGADGDIPELESRVREHAA